MSLAGSDRAELITRVVAGWSESLINLTGRNRLLNFSPKKTSSVPITVPADTEVLIRLKSGRRLDLQPLREPSSDSDVEVRPASSLPAQSGDWTDPGPAVARDPSALGADVDPKALSNALRTLMTRTNQAFLDTGLWTLYVAFGTLAWTDPADSKKYRSPLILVPVNLKSPGRRMPAQLTLGQEDTVVNPALVLKMQLLDLELEREVDLEGPMALNSYLERLEQLISSRSDWSVSREVHLSYFTFHKEAMYRDLLDNLDLVMDSEQVQALALSGQGDEEVDFNFEALADDQVDAADPPERAHQVLDADASQRAAIIAASGGNSFIIDGPPGTGKSQTIANIIASLIPQGRSVLFVSEKAAALEVVKNRLEAVGLGAYVLELHSHKATRKEVAEALGNALSFKPRGQRNLDATDLRRLRSAREDLSAYATEMNRIREPLGVSLHDAIGWVALLDHLPPVRPCQGDLRGLSADDLAEVKDAAERLAGAWRPALQGDHFLWRQVTTHASLAFELNDLESRMTQLREVSSANWSVLAAFGWDQPSDLRLLSETLDVWHTRPTPTPGSWLQVESLEPIRQAANASSLELTDLRAKEARAAELAGSAWRDLHATSSSLAYASLIDGAQSLVPPLPALEASTVADLDKAAVSLLQVGDLLADIMATTVELSADLGLRLPRSFEDIAAVREVERLSRHRNRPESDWFTAEVDGNVEAGISQLRLANALVSEAEDAARPFFTRKVLDLDPNALLIRFQNIHKGLRKLGGEYRQDLRTLAEASQPGITGKANISNLTLACTWQDALSHREEIEGKFAALVGPRYAQSETDWSALQDALNNARAIVSVAGQSVRETMRKALGREGVLDPANKERSRRLEEMVTRFRLLANSDDEPWTPEALVQLAPIEAQLWVTRAHELVAEARALTLEVDQAVSTESTVGQAYACRLAYEEANSAADAFADASPRYAALLSTAFDGLETRIDHLAESVDWAGRFRQHISASSRAGNRTTGAVDETQLAACDASVPSPALGRAIEEYEGAVQAVCSGFEPDRAREIRDDLDSWDEGLDLLRALQSDSAGQDEWFAYANAVKVLEPLSLKDVVSSAAESRVAAADVEGILLREVMRRWSDQCIQADAVLQEARSTTRDTLAEQYRDLDEQLIAASVSRVIDETNEFRPTSLAGQAGIIQAEGRKMRRHMPIRELLARTADVTLTLKPVFMMSPLAVSQYLPPDLRFDVVIFDEASQVMPEDAINCIYRGRSLIVAGDEKQLPPTNFFDLGASDADEAWEEDQSSAKDFESVLSIAKGCGAFTSLTLKWHYRSRHESLIAFSNARFYEGQLITFPSSEVEGGHLGVEFYVVPDGIYDRGGTRRNMVEARYVAERIAHHYDTRPGMSLGVVAFSQAQAEAIQLALDELLVSRSELESQFGTSRLDGLFIKNLESVQGDERDVMIFSLGYGPDADGKLTMNFGPINRSGGWRRLNVAITRARYRNEVVASFQASQMSHSSARGVADLRRYMDYAANGHSALSLDDAESLGDAESPFEESVLSWLRSEGYSVTPQVGTSGYRIDMAVRHPEHPSRFVIGIECDGAAYHSSRTARDRDRLRAQVLEGLGWRLHRIWGTSWYRHREHEQQRLREAIEAAIAEPPRGLLPRPVVPSASLHTEIGLDAVELAEISEWATPYVVSSPPSAPSYVEPAQEESLSHHVRIIEHVVSVEGPVHMAVLDQRMRDAWQVGRIGANIRRRILMAIEASEVQVDGDFLLASGFNGDFPTRTHSVDDKRDIAHIHPGEIQETVYRVAKDAGSVTEADLVTSTARHLGFARVGEDVRESIESAIASLQSCGRLTRDDSTRIRILPPQA